MNTITHAPTMYSNTDESHTDLPRTPMQSQVTQKISQLLQRVFMCAKFAAVSHKTREIRSGTETTYNVHERI